MKLKCANCGKVFETTSNDEIQKCPYCGKELHVKQATNKSTVISDWDNNRDLLLTINTICYIIVVFVVIFSISYFINKQWQLGITNLVYVLPLLIEIRINKYIILNTERIDALTYKYIDGLLKQVEELKTQNKELITRIERLERENNINV